jgi:hypothetical protein
MSAPAFGSLAALGAAALASSPHTAMASCVRRRGAQLLGAIRAGPLALNRSHGPLRPARQLANQPTPCTQQQSLHRTCPSPGLVARQTPLTRGCSSPRSTTLKLSPLWCLYGEAPAAPVGG